MKNLNKYKILKKALTYRRKEIAKLITTVAFAISSIIIMLLIMNISEDALLKAFYNNYGKHTISITVPEYSSYDKIAKDQLINSSLPYSREYYEVKGMYYTVYYADETILEFTNFNLLDGSYPRNENEIVISKSYLFKQGIPENEMVGATIVLPINDKGDTRQYIVSGIMAKNTIFSSNNNTVEILKFDSGNLKYDNLYVELNDIKEYESIMEVLVNKYGLNKEECYANIDLFMELGLNEDINMFENNRNMLKFFCFIIFCSTIVIIYNVFKKYLLYNLQSLKIMDILGFPAVLVGGTMLVLLLKILLMSTVVAMVLSIVISLVINFMLEGTINGYIEYIKATDIEILIFAIAIYWLLIISINYKSITEFSESISKKISRPKKKVKHIIKSKKNNVINLMSNINIKSNMFNTVMCILSFALISIVFTLCVYWVSCNKKSFGYDDNMDYKIHIDTTMCDDDEIANIYNMIKKYDSECYIYPNYCTFTNMLLDKNTISKEQKIFLSQQDDYAIQMLSAAVQKFEVNITVLGYTEKQIENLYKINNIESDKINENDVIVLDRVVAYKGEKGYPTGIDKDQTIKINTFANNKNDTQEFTVKHVVSDLEVYPDNAYGKMCIIVNEEVFKRIFAYEAPNEIFIQVNNNKYFVSESIQEIVSGIDGIEISFPKEERKELNDTNDIFMIIVSGLCILLTAIIAYALSSAIYLRRYVNKNKFALLSILGIDKAQQKMIFLLELFKIYVASQLIAIPFCLLGTYYIRKNQFGEYGILTYKYPIELSITASIVILVMIMFFALPQNKRFEERESMLILKSDN